MRPIDLDPLPLRETIVKKQFLVPATMLVDESRHLDVEAAILGDFHDPTLAPPADRVETGGGFLHPERGVRDRIETEPMAEALLHIEHQIGGRQLVDRSSIGVAHEDVIIEVQRR